MPRTSKSTTRGASASFLVAFCCFVSLSLSLSLPLRPERLVHDQPNTGTCTPQLNRAP